MWETWKAKMNVTISTLFTFNIFPSKCLKAIGFVELSRILKTFHGPLIFLIFNEDLHGSSQ